jgi:hypothetical protein
MVGYPLLPTVSYSFADPDISQWQWLRQHQQKPAAAAAAAAGGWEDTGCRSMCYTPTEADLGCVLRVECTPGVDASSQQQQQMAAANGDVACGEAATAETGETTAGTDTGRWSVRPL